MCRLSNSSPVRKIVFKLICVKKIYLVFSLAKEKETVSEQNWEMRQLRVQVNMLKHENLVLNDTNKVLVGHFQST